MEHNYTQDAQFIRYLYGETQLIEDAQIASLLETNWDAKERFEEFQQIIDFLNSTKLKAPSRTSLDIILKYSKTIRQPEVTY